MYATITASLMCFPQYSTIYNILAFVIIVPILLFVFLLTVAVRSVDDPFKIKDELRLCVYALVGMMIVYCVGTFVIQPLNDTFFRRALFLYFMINLIMLLS